MTLNAFSMGAWAAGMNMSLGMTRHGIVKSIGPDVDKLLSTLTYLGPSYRFLISGYPPFLKHLLDEGERRGFPWADYEVHGLVGGEGMTEELRDVLLERFRSVYSGYGATDIEIGMAAVARQRRRTSGRPPPAGCPSGAIRGDPRLPMVFQYNPLIHFLEVNEIGEVICTVSARPSRARIRYASTTRAGSSNSPTFAIGSLHSVSTSRRWAPPRRPLGRVVPALVPADPLAVPVRSTVAATPRSA